MNAEPKIILGSASPRRQQLLKEIFSRVEVRIKNVNEDFPAHLKAEAIPVYLSVQKANAFNGELNANEFLVTADTVVWFDGHVMNKPAGRNEALEMLQKLSGHTHQVFTGVTLRSATTEKIFSVESKVTFRKFPLKDLEGYVDQYSPYDKAGAYGAQECLPEGLKPLSEKEMAFLHTVSKPALFEKSLAVKEGSRFPLIERIEGSYFNVMGLPVVELYEALHSLSH